MSFCDLAVQLVSLVADECCIVLQCFFSINENENEDKTITKLKR